ncbi:MAG: SusC/RagA family TonB-linked outer membrane protein [Chitinophagaceae bacterium]|nr:SusC/RagA family TonB-linked outer membrane protein [Chitinophagaceae bacterium]
MKNYLLKTAKRLTLFIVLTLPHFVYAQSLTDLTGTIIDERGNPLQGVTVLLQSKGERNQSVNTNQKGIYILKQLAIGSKYSIKFSYVGYTGVEQLVTINKGAINIVTRMSSLSSELTEVVVTALGIKKQEKALGYAAQTLKEGDVLDARSNNWVSSLSGKVAGLNLYSAGSGPGGSVRVSLRGDASMNPDGNNALIVIDGVPMNGSGTSSGVGNAYGAGSGSDVPVDFGNGISDINPDDIESITVLKGPGATALYGSRAANGALLITTKSGVRKDKGIGISFNSNVSMNTVLSWPDYQYEYGQGTGRALNAAGEKYYSYGTSADGGSTSGTSSAFGPRFNGQQYFQYDPNLEGQSATRLPWVAQPNNIKGFWRTGSTIANNISLESGNENGSVRASLTHSKNEWIMPNTGFERMTAALSVSQKISDKLKFVSKVNYTNKSSDNLPATGYNNQSIAYFMIFQNPNVDLSWYRPLWKKGQEQVDQVHPFSSFIDNPYMIAYEMTNTVKSNAFLANMATTYTINSKFNLMLRSGIDLSSEIRKQQRPYSSANYLRGFYKEQNIQDYEINSDFLLSYKDKIGSDINVTASAGGNAMSANYNRTDAAVIGLVIPGVYMLSNGVGTPEVVNVARNKKVNSLYGTASVSYKNKWFVDITGRNDWSSTLPVQNNSFFYPSINTSLILSDLLALPALVSFAKFRLSAAQVGNDTDPYKTSKYYGTSPFPGSGSVPTLLHNVDFKPEISTNYEAGLDIRLFKSRLNLDLTVYSNTTRNQILEVPMDPTTGYARAVLNAGAVRNQGIEVVLTGNIIKKKNFSWNTILTWAKNQNRLMELAEGMEGKQDIGYGGNATIQARVGGTTGDIYGFGFLRSTDGQIVYNATGLPARPQEIQYIGSAYADWKGGIRNEFSYNNFRFSFLIDGQLGGMIYSQSHHKMMEQGKLKSSLMGREENFIIGAGVVQNPDKSYSTNTTKVLPVDYYGDYYRRANVESNSFDASYLKLREARLEYNFPKSILGKSLFKQLSVALYGRDLLMITSFPIFDPETAALNGSTILPGVEMGQLPSSRTFGVNITVKF